MLGPRERGPSCARRPRPPPATATLCSLLWSAAAAHWQISPPILNLNAINQGAAWTRSCPFTANQPSMRAM